MSNNPLDTLASEASSEAALAVEGGKRPAEQAPQEQEQEQEQGKGGNEEQSLEAEEAAGGPPLPPAGQEAAALKPDLFHQEHRDSEPNGGAGEALHSDVPGGVGDAAMAAVDDRLDSKGEQALPHTNGFIDNAEDKAVRNEVDSTRVEHEGGRVPSMSVDVEQPARQQANGDGSSRQPEPEQQQGEAILPAPGADESVPLEQIDEQQQPSANGLPHLNGEGHEGVNGAAQSLSAQPSSSTLQDDPVPAEETRSQDQAPLNIDTLLNAPEKPNDPSNGGGADPTPSKPLSEEQQPPLSMDALPDDPAPLPSQLVQGHAPTSTDIHQDVTASSLPQAEQQQPAPRSPFTSGEPTIPADAERVPPTNPATMPGLSADLASPSLAKRPFEPDTEDARARDYFGEAIEEPSSKRQKLTPPPSAASGAEHSTSTAASQQPSADAPTGPAAGVPELNTMPEQAADHPEIQFGMDDMGEKAGEADAEGEPEMEADQSGAAPFGNASMADQTIDQSLNESMVSGVMAIELFAFGSALTPTLSVLCVSRMAISLTSKMHTISPINNSSQSHRKHCLRFQTQPSRAHTTMLSPLSLLHPLLVPHLAFPHRKHLFHQHLQLHQSRRRCPRSSKSTLCRSCVRSRSATKPHPSCSLSTRSRSASPPTRRS